MEVRRATQEDLAAIRHVIVETWRSTYAPIHGSAVVEDIIQRWHSPHVLEKQLAQKHTLFGVAELDGVISGHVYTQQMNDTVCISRLYVLDNAQGKGLGRAMLQWAMDELPDAVTVSLEVDQENRSAIAFYEKLGMKIEDVIPCCGNDSDIPAYLMKASRQDLRMN